MLFDPEEPRRFVLYEIYQHQAAFDEHLASSRYASFAGAIENEVERRSISHLAFCSEMATSEVLSKRWAEPQRATQDTVT